MRSKRANETVGMSVSTIFSIFLIVVFIAVAFVAIKFFLSMSEKSQLRGFYKDLQKEINDAWSSAGTERSFEIDLPNKIEYVCFVDLSAEEGTGQWKELFSDFKVYDFNEYNVFLYPSDAAGDFDKKFIDHFNVNETTAQENPYCVANPSDIMINKDVYSSLVWIN